MPEVKVVTEYVTVTETITETVVETVEIENTAKIDKYKALISNLNGLLENVYYVYNELDNGAWSAGTGFSIEYKGKYYIITAGHIVENEYGYFPNLGFKNDGWIYPELIYYVHGATVDYAIFEGNINSGLEVSREVGGERFVLGYGKLNTIKHVSADRIAGECGSPIINLNGEVTGILTRYESFMPIGYVLDRIDKLK